MSKWPRTTFADPLIEYTQPQYEQRRAVLAHSASTPASANRRATYRCGGLVPRQSSEGQAEFRLFTMAGMV
ncbi:MAG: hypothetical protein WAN75_29725, partial [Xanthobacteraceae bacterium]